MRGSRQNKQKRKILEDCMGFPIVVPVPTQVPVETKGSPYFEPHFKKYERTLDFINNQ